MGIKRTLTRELVCDGCGKYEFETTIHDDEGLDYEDFDTFDSEHFVSTWVPGPRDYALLCALGGDAKRSCKIKYFERIGYKPTQCDVLGHDDEQIGIGEHEGPLYCCKCCGRKREGLDIKALDNVLKTIYIPLATHPLLDLIPRNASKCESAEDI